MQRMLIVSLLSLGLMGTVAQAEENVSHPSTSGTNAASTPQIDTQRQTQTLAQAGASDFWAEAASLVRQQVYLSSQAETVLNEADANRVRSLRGQLILHDAAVRRFVRDRALPTALCGSFQFAVSPSSTVAEVEDLRQMSARNAGLEPDQVVTYCQIQQTRDRLMGLLPVLQRRIIMLADVSPLRPILLPNQAGTGGRTPAPDAIAPVPEPDVAPAVAPPLQALAILQPARQEIRQTQALFPQGYAFTDPDLAPILDDQLAFGVHASEQEQYADFIAAPHQGIARIHQATTFERPRNRLANRASRVLDRYPFPELSFNPTGSSAAIPRLAVHIQNGRFELVEDGINYGFMADLGRVDLEQVTADSAEIPAPFLTYQPPTRLAALQTERLAFADGRTASSDVKPLYSHAPVIEGHTYVARLIQFELPAANEPQVEFYQTRDRVGDRMMAESGDVLIAFQPLHRRTDGSYTVLWRVLHEFSDPVIIVRESRLVP